MNTLQESIKRGQDLFSEQFIYDEDNEALWHNYGEGNSPSPVTAEDMNKFLVTFARNVATEALEAVRLKERKYNYRNESVKVVNDSINYGWKEAMSEQSQLIINYLKGEEDEKDL